MHCALVAVVLCQPPAPAHLGKSHVFDSGGCSAAVLAPPRQFSPDKPLSGENAFLRITLAPETRSSLPCVLCIALAFPTSPVVPRETSRNPSKSAEGLSTVREIRKTATGLGTSAPCSGTSASSVAGRRTLRERATPRHGAPYLSASRGGSRGVGRGGGVNSLCRASPCVPCRAPPCGGGGGRRQGVVPRTSEST